MLLSLRHIYFSLFIGLVTPLTGCDANMHEQYLKVEVEHAEKIDVVSDVLRKRFQKAGFSDIQIMQKDDRLLEISLRFSDGAMAYTSKNLIHSNATLRIHFVYDDKDGLYRFNKYNVIPSEALELEFFEDQPSLLINKEHSIDGQCLEDASASLHPSQPTPVVNFVFNKKCADEFASLTSQNIGKQFAVVINDKILAAPFIRTPIKSGRGFIEGGFEDMEEAKNLSYLLASGDMPTRIVLVEEKINYAD